MTHCRLGTSLVNESRTGLMRCVYFVLFGAMFLAVDAMHKGGSGGGMSLYGVNWRELLATSVVRALSLALVLALPLLWLFGHLPMWWRTLLHYCLEQIDSVLLGGGGSKSLAGASTRLAATVVALFCCALAAGLLSTPITESATRVGLFQLVCIVFSFLIARCPADPR
jgi:hypothetical protein